MRRINSSASIVVLSGQGDKGIHFLSGVEVWKFNDTQHFISKKGRKKKKEGTSADMAKWQLLNVAWYLSTNYIPFHSFLYV